LAGEALDEVSLEHQEADEDGLGVVVQPHEASGEIEGVADCCRFTELK
jgi:hypothetical protein